MHLDVVAVAVADDATLREGEANSMGSFERQRPAADSFILTFFLCAGCSIVCGMTMMSAGVRSLSRENPSVAPKPNTRNFEFAIRGP
jgi:hypothetical protein